MEPAQSTKLQTDDSSSSSPSSGSDDDLNTGMQQVALAGQQESLDERPPASSLELDLEEEFQIQQHHSTTTATAPLGNQQTKVNIFGGDYRGAQIVGSQTTHQHYNLTKQEFIDQRQIHQTINVLQQQPESVHPAASQHQEQTSESDCIQLSDSIRMFHRKKINKTGNVFKGEQVSSVTGYQPLAVKSLQFDEKNKREAQILTKLRPHKHVVSIVHSDVYHQGPMPYIYIAMELCHEQNLHDHVIENKNNNVLFDPQLSISQAKQLIEGLNHIHSNNIIHRDLKPHNVLFSLDHQNLKIGDFGISKPMTRGLTKTKVTNVGAGTDGYRAPETFNNDEISQKADIYSLGLIFYFLWSNGHHPFGEDPVGWDYKIKTNQRYDLSKLLVSDKEMATDLLQWMLQIEAVNRPTTAQIFNHKLFGGSLVSPEAVTSLKDKANLYFDKGQYQMAEVYLKKLVDLQKDPWEQLETLQQIAECHVMLDQPCANDINNIISTCQSLQRSPDDIESTANKHLESSHLVRAYVMCVCASTMYRSCDAVVSLSNCTWSMWNIVKAMKNQPRLRMIASSQVISSIYDMLDQLREIKEVSDDVKVENEAECLTSIGLSHYELDEYDKALDNYNKAMQIMQSKFGSNSVKYQVFGILLNNVGLVYYNLNNNLEALTYYQQSIDAYQKAEDWSTEEEKQKFIELAKNNLRFCQNEINLKPNN